MNSLDPALMAIGPLDGRYRRDVEELAPFFSEFALIRYRVRIEIEYLLALAREKTLPEPEPLSPVARTQLRDIYRQFSLDAARRVKTLEATTGHDVKAVEYFLREQLEHSGYSQFSPWIHFALTSEDVNNLAYSLMWKDALQQVVRPLAGSLRRRLHSLAHRYRHTSLLALTHGQPATPTTLGKELAVFERRLERQLGYLKTHRLQGKFSGATGTWGAHHAAFPQVDWIAFSRCFIQSLDLEPNLVTTQIESHDALAESYHALVRVNTILIDLCRDLWLYISREILQQQPVASEVGSSTMPHKINPIQFENAEGNLEISSALLNHLATKLPVSRLQRDLSGSTAIRNQGLALAHSVLAQKNILRGLDRVKVDAARAAAELDAHWEVLGEAIQTVLRKSGNPRAYEELKRFLRGRKVTRELLHEFIATLDLSAEQKAALLALEPRDYTGLAAKATEL